MIVAVELADGAVALPRLEPARRRTLILLGHEWRGILEEHVEAADLCVEIPMSDEARARALAGAHDGSAYRQRGRWRGGVLRAVFGFDDLVW